MHTEKSWATETALSATSCCFGYCWRKMPSWSFGFNLLLKYIAEKSIMQSMSLKSCFFLFLLFLSFIVKIWSFRLVSFCLLFALHDHKHGFNYLTVATTTKLVLGLHQAKRFLFLIFRKPCAESRAVFIKNEKQLIGNLRLRIWKCGLFDSHWRIRSWYTW